MPREQILAAASYDAFLLFTIIGFGTPAIILLWSLYRWAEKDEKDLAQHDNDLRREVAKY